MPRLSWNEIQHRATEFAARWAGETYEKGESQSFWSEFLTVYGIDRRRHGAFFEYAIKKTGNRQGFIDLFWPGKLLAEQKSAGRDLEAARTQALDYLPAMPDHDLPRAIVVSDFQTFEVLDLDTDQITSFTLEQLPYRVRAFGFLIEDSNKFITEELPVNRDAAESMARVYTQLAASGYTGRDLELLLVRLVFCMFADDALIFERGSFKRLIDTRTRDDGSDLGLWLAQLFQVLDTPEDQRQTTLDADLKAFPYIDGGLFEGHIRLPSFNAAMRHAITSAAFLDWSEVSPAIFGSMFQGVMDEDQRRNLGAHYTSERNTLRLIQPLFLDDLYAEFERVRYNKTSLRKFHDKLAGINVLDPACGSGNFLVITYRELRRLEHRVVAELLKGQQVLDVRGMLRVNVDQMHGIDIEEFPALIAQTALWLTDHQMNLEASAMLGQHYVRLPLAASANVVQANALTTDWAEIVSPEKLTYILGNPPFVGHQHRTAGQVADMHQIWGHEGSFNRLDYATCWYKKAAEFTRSNQAIQVALVATSSISQGEQVRPLWETLSDDGIQINFAHRAFQWTNDARGVAAVHCVIEGFGRTAKRPKRIFSYPNVKGDPIEDAASQINGYLVDAPMVFINSRAKPPPGMPTLEKGSQPTDGGFLLMSEEEANELRLAEPIAAPYIRRYVGAREFLNGGVRYCLWLKGASPQEIRRMPSVMDRLKQVRELRLASPTESVQRFADRPYLFTQDRQPDTDYILVPSHSSENRDYIPIGYMSKDYIVSNACQFIADATAYLFAVMTSAMHMAWTRAVCGRIKSDFRYIPAVYNNFPWPYDVIDVRRQEIEALAQAVLDARDRYPDSSLADLYDPLTMPPDLARAHQTLDRAVDRLYRKKPFESDKERLELLFERYRALTEAQG